MSLILTKHFNITKKLIADRKLLKVFILFIFISTLLASCAGTKIQQFIKEYPAKETYKALVICRDANAKQFIPFRRIKGASAFSSDQPSEEAAILGSFWLIELAQTSLHSCTLVKINNSSVSETNALYWKNYYYKNSSKYKFTYKDFVGVVVEKNN